MGIRIRIAVAADELPTAQLKTGRRVIFRQGILFPRFTVARLTFTVPATVSTITTTTSTVAVTTSATSAEIVSARLELLARLRRSIALFPRSSVCAATVACDGLAWQ